MSVKRIVQQVDDVLPHLIDELVHPIVFKQHQLPAFLVVHTKQHQHVTMEHGVHPLLHIQLVVYLYLIVLQHHNVHQQHRDEHV